MDPSPHPTALARQVSRFYAAVRQDPELGPLFNEIIHDWPHHETKLTAFWCGVMGAAPPDGAAYRGNPMAAHLKHQARLTPALFDRWLALWADTAADTLPPDTARAVVSRAQRIATSLQLGLFYRPA